jgi:hypothetical protein
MAIVNGGWMLILERRIPALTFVSSRQKVARNPLLHIASAVSTIDTDTF